MLQVVDMLQVVLRISEMRPKIMVNAIKNKSHVKAVNDEKRDENSAI